MFDKSIYFIRYSSIYVAVIFIRCLWKQRRLKSIEAFLTHTCLYFEVGIRNKRRVTCMVQIRNRFLRIVRPKYIHGVKEMDGQTLVSCSTDICLNRNRKILPFPVIDIFRF